MWTMKLLFTLSPLLLGLFVPSSWASPVVADRFNGVSHNDNVIVKRNTCSSSWIQAAETRANKGPHQTISSLCSSLQGKYKTVTHSVYTKTVTPKTTVNQATTAPRHTVTGTRTVQVTQKATHTEGSTSVVDVTTLYTETSVVETDYVTVAQVPGLKRAQAPCQQIESLLTLSAGSAYPFCSCYDTGPTSTKTVTCDGATTAPAVSATHYTKTITPTPSTAFATVAHTTTVVTTIESGTVITSTVSAETTISVTDVITSTVAPPAPTNTGYLVVQNPNSPYNGYYAFIDETDDDVPIQFTPTKSHASIFNVDGSGHLNIRGDFIAEQSDFAPGSQAAYNMIFMLDTGSAVGAGYPLPVCALSPASQLTCSQLSNGDPRSVLSLCPFISGGAPYLILDATNDGCETALLFLVAA